MEGVRDSGTVPERQRPLLKPTRLRALRYGAASNERKTKMKLKVNWKAVWEALKPVLLAAIGGGVVTLADGCSSLTPSAKTQSMSLYAIGIPGIAIVTQSEQTADNKGDDDNTPLQANPVTTTTSLGK